MLDSRGRVGLLGLVLMGLSVPAAAQTWPSDSGPVGDFLGSTVRQFERLGPPPVEAGGVAERVVPDMPRTDLGAGSVVVGLPFATQAPERAARPRRAETRRVARRPSRNTVPVSRRSNDRDGLLRELEERDRQIRDLQRQVEDERRRVRELRGVRSSLLGTDPTATPR